MATLHEADGSTVTVQVLKIESGCVLVRYPWGVAVWVPLYQVDDLL